MSDLCKELVKLGVPLSTEGEKLIRTHITELEEAISHHDQVTHQWSKELQDRDEKIADLESRLSLAEGERDEMRSILGSALLGFKCTQRPESYPDSHWCNQAIKVLTITEQSHE